LESEGIKSSQHKFLKVVRRGLERVGVSSQTHQKGKRIKKLGGMAGEMGLFMHGTQGKDVSFGNF